MDQRILSSRAAATRFSPASRLLGRDVRRLCASKTLFRSTEECFVTTLAAEVTVAEDHLRQGDGPDILLASSFGHYAALVMARSLDYLDALKLAGKNGRLIDRHFAGQHSYLVNGLEREQLAFLAARLPWAGAVINYSDGMSITAHRSAASIIRKMVANLGGNITSIPLRLNYHTVLMRQVEQLTWPNFAQARFRQPSIPFLSTACGRFINRGEELGNAMRTSLSTRNMMEEAVRLMMRLEIKTVVHMETRGHSAKAFGQGRKKPAVSGGTACGQRQTQRPDPPAQIAPEEIPGEIPIAHRTS